MQGLATETLNACVVGAHGGQDGEYGMGQLNISVCATGLLLRADKIKQER